eukprot:2896000-Prymnesium_polylepis.1
MPGVCAALDAAPVAPEVPRVCRCVRGGACDPVRSHRCVGELELVEALLQPQRALGARHEHQRTPRVPPPLAPRQQPLALGEGLVAARQHALDEPPEAHPNPPLLVVGGRQQHVAHVLRHQRERAQLRRRLRDARRREAATRDV